MKRGRRTLLTANLQKQICKLLAQGHTIKTVCEAVGIAERTYYDWQKHPHFSQATTCAIGQSKIFLVEKLRQSDDWRAQAFLLERRWPQEYGRVERRVEQLDENKNIGVNIWYNTGGQSIEKLLAFPIHPSMNQVEGKTPESIGDQE